MPTVFIRLTGCPLRCQYCDTAYAFEGGELRELGSICTEVASFGSKLVTVTGGEPLAQPNCKQLMRMLCDKGYQVSLETSGAMPIEAVDERVSIVLDLKTPGSLECDKNRFENIASLRAKDQVKFVICGREYYDWSKAQIDRLQLQDKVEEILFAPSHAELEAADLAGWVLEDSLNVRVQLQLHKMIWGTDPGR